MKHRKFKQEIYVTLQIEGIHNWPDCNIEEVQFLKYPHRHLFGIKAYKEVGHSNRDIEFIELKHSIQEYLRKKYWNKEKRIYLLGAKSCEMLAIELIQEFDLIKCEVNEDNENGSIVTVKEN